MSFFYRLLIATRTGANIFVLFYNPYIHTIILINKHPFIGGKNIFKRRGWKERSKVNFCLLVKLLVFAYFHPPVRPNVRVEN